MGTLIDTTKLSSSYKFLKSFNITLSYDANPICVKDFQNLEKLIVKYNKIKDVSSLIKLKSLECVDIPKGLDTLKLQKLRINNVNYEKLIELKTCNTIKKLSIH